MKRIISGLLFLVMLFSFSYAELAEISNTKKYLIENVGNPVSSSTGGEWAVLGISRDEKNDLYFNTYYKNLEKKIKENKGILSERKYTEYARVVIALSAINKNPLDVAGYNLVSKLEEYDKVTKQGINGAIFALIALDCKTYETKDLECRNKYVNYILSKQLIDGGFSLDGKNSDIDVTAMAIQALSNYINDEKVKEAVNNGLKYLSSNQETYGGYASCETTAQVIVALCETNISLTSEEFVKDENTLIDGLKEYYLNDGSFKHSIADKQGNLMSTEQALYAMVAYDRQINGQTSLYDMSDIKAESNMLIQFLEKLNWLVWF